MTSGLDQLKGVPVSFLTDGTPVYIGSEKPDQPRKGKLLGAHAKQIILDEIIGPNERYETPPGNHDRIIRNEFREELRKKIEAL